MEFQLWRRIWRQTYSGVLGQGSSPLFGGRFGAPVGLGRFLMSGRHCAGFQPAARSYSLRRTLAACGAGTLELAREIPYASAMRIYKDFKFEAAHFLPNAELGTANARVHGHSFRARVVIDGEPNADTGYVFHFDDLRVALADTQDALDHRLLNDVEGLAAPTLERIAMWVWNRLANKVPGLAEVHVSRDSCDEGCIYAGPHIGARGAITASPKTGNDHG